ncbi:hypothetical protein DQ806_05035 [Salmonella enterica subsp. enterica serovar Okatie]|nr:hypothetical protein [Salmonella enterica subsp. enterica serovar Okatie]
MGQSLKVKAPHSSRYKSFSALVKIFPPILSIGMIVHGCRLHDEEESRGGVMAEFVLFLIIMSILWYGCGQYFMAIRPDQ